MSNFGDRPWPKLGARSKRLGPFTVMPPVRERLIHPPADWDFPRRTIIITGLPRSGTTYLGELMTCSGILGRPDEYFNRDNASWYDARRGDDVAFQLTLPNTVGRSENGIASTKIFARQFDRICRHANLLEFYPDPVFVHVRRRDILGQAVSLARARQTDAWSSKRTPKSEPHFSAEFIHEGLMDLMFQQARWTAYFARNCIRPLEIWYEDLSGNEESILRQIAGLANLDEAGGRINFEQPDLSVQSDKLNAEWRERFIAERGDPNWVEGGIRRRSRGKLRKLIRFLRGKPYRP